MMAKGLLENMFILAFLSAVLYGSYLFLYQPDVFSAYLSQTTEWGSTFLKEGFTKSVEFTHNVIQFLTELNQSSIQKG